MRVQHPEQDSKKGAALIMVMLSGMLIVILGIGMLFFYQKQVERRMKLEFDIHRRLAAKSGFNLVQYSGTGTYVYAVAPNRPVILVTVGEVDPIYSEPEGAVRNTDAWMVHTNLNYSVQPQLPEERVWEFSTTDHLETGLRTELVFNKPDVDIAWNNYPFGLCYDIRFTQTGGDQNVFPWIGYLYVGASNVWDQTFVSNVVVSLSVKEVNSAERRLDLFNHLRRGTGSPYYASSDIGDQQRVPMNLPTELFVDGNHMAFGGAQEGGGRMVFEGIELDAGFSSITNDVVLGFGAYNHEQVPTNRVLTVSVFEVRNPYKYQIDLSWTNQNRFLGPTGAVTNILATVVDKTALGNDYYFFDSFETVVP
jgi:hypothetical protein